MTRTTRSRGFWPCASLLLAACWSRPAAAHFLWLERDPQAGLQACFGEPPTERESGELLTKIAGVQVRTVGAATAPATLPVQRGATGYIVSAPPPAPAYVASLDYGVVRRGQQEPFFLRYEALDLVGDGQPLTTAQAATLAGLPSPLQTTLAGAAAGPGRLSLNVAHAGQPTAAVATWQPPGAISSQEQELDPAQTVVVPVQPGRNMIRLLTLQRGERQVGEQTVALTKTYLLLTFTASAEADPECVRLLDEAHRARAAWPAGFPGFRAKAVVELGSQRCEGQVTVAKDGTVEYGLPLKAAKSAVQPAFNSLVGHRTGGNPTYQATWLDPAPHPLGGAIALHDEAGSVYRVADRQILEVRRRFNGGWFQTTVVENEFSKAGLLPRAWTVTYYNADGAIRETVLSSATWGWVGDYFVPLTLQRVAHTVDGPLFWRLTLSEHALLP